MATTEQQFLDAYAWYSPEMQQQIYNAWNAQVKAMIDRYNASQSTQSTSPTQTQTYTPTTTYTPSQNYTNQATNWGDLGSWNYWEDTQRRQQEIENNLNEYYASNPEKFSDWSTFANSFNYNYSWRSDMERETMRNWYEQNVANQMDYNNANNTDYFFSQLMWWGTLQWTWAAANAAYNRYRNYQTLSSMSPDQIVDAIASWALNPVWQDMIDLKNYSPALYAQVQNAMQNNTAINDINAVWQWIYNWLTGTETNWNYTNYKFTTEYMKNASVIKQYNESLYKKIEWLGWDTAAYVEIVASMLQNPLIQANKDEIEELEWQINKIQENIYTIWDTAREKLWSEAPEDLVSAYISHQTKQLQNQLRTTQNSLLVAQWKLDNQLSEVETLIDAINNGIEIQQYNDKMALAWVPTTTTTSSRWWGWTWWIWWAYTTTTTPVDNNNYQDDSTARLQEIQRNLEDYYKNYPEKFKDRATFNAAFNYDKRSAKQKAVLDSFWMQKKWMIWGVWIWWWSWTATTTEDNLVNAIKKDLISRTVNFSSTAMKKTYWSYWTQAQSWDEDTTNDYLQEIWKISSLSELKSMLSHLSKDANKKALLSSLRTKVINELSAIEWEWRTEEKRAEDKKKKQNAKLQEYANKLWVDKVTLATRWWILKK